MSRASTPPPITILPTVSAIADFYAQGPIGTPVLVHNLKEFERKFGSVEENREAGAEVSLFFDNEGGDLWVIRLDRGIPSHLRVSALTHAIDAVPDLSLFAVPPVADIPPNEAAEADEELLKYAESRLAFVVLDAPHLLGTNDPGDAVIHWVDRHEGLRQRSGALYFPRVVVADNKVVPSSGAVEGRIAATDRTNGVWTSPAGVSFGHLNGVYGVGYVLNEQMRGKLISEAINPLATLNHYGTTIYGARTLKGVTALQPDFIAPARLGQLIERSIVHSDGWMADQPIDARLWSEVSTWTGTFLSHLESDKAIYGYSVTCGTVNNNDEDIAHGRVNVRIQFAPVHPAEFEILKLTLKARATPRR